MLRRSFKVRIYKHLVIIINYFHGPHPPGELWGLKGFYFLQRERHLINSATSPEENFKQRDLKDKAVRPLWEITCEH